MMDKLKVFEEVSKIWFKLVAATEDGNAGLMAELDNELELAYEVLKEQGIEAQYWAWFDEQYS